MKKTLLSILVLSFFLTGCVNENELITSEIPMQKVETINVKKELKDDFYETSAGVTSTTTSVVASMIMGRVTGLKVKEGDTVKAGQTLLTIDARDTAQKAMGARASVAEAQKAAEMAYQNKKMATKTYLRYKNLYDEKVMTAQEFDQIATQKNIAEMDYQRALQGVARARAGLGEVGVYQSYAKVTSPVDGTVVQKNIDLGSTAIAGQPLFVIEKTANKELVANVAESYLDKIKVGKTVYVETDLKSITSQIVAVVPKIDPVSRTFKVKILANGLNSGAYTKIKIPVDKKQMITVPNSSIVQKGQLIGVYTIDEKNIVSYRLIRTGKTFGNHVEVLSGLDDGDKIITEGVEKAVDGGKIQ